MELAVIAFLGLLSLAVYFLPAFFASDRGHPSVTAIFIFNLLLGWTFLGWVLALVWAFSGENMAKVKAEARFRAASAATAAKRAEGDLRKCPMCAELIRREALKCRFCGSEVPAHQGLAPPAGR